MTYLWQDDREWVEFAGPIDTFRAQCIECNSIFDYYDEPDATKWYNEHDCGTR